MSMIIIISIIIVNSKDTFEVPEYWLRVLPYTPINTYI
jgi:hypothetical protein